MYQPYYSSSIEISSCEDLIRLFPKIEKQVVIDFYKVFGSVAAYDYLLDLQLRVIKQQNQKNNNKPISVPPIKKRKYQEIAEQEDDY